MKNLHAHVVFILLNQDNTFYMNGKDLTTIEIQEGIL